jgi:thioredoxin 1
VNVDENQDLASKYGVVSIPRILIFKGSDQPVNQMVGLTSEVNLSKMIKDVL